MVTINNVGHNGRARLDYFKEEQPAPTRISNPADYTYRNPNNLGHNGLSWRDYLNEELQVDTFEHKPDVVEYNPLPEPVKDLFGHKEGRPLDECGFPINEDKPAPTGGPAPSQPAPTGEPAPTPVDPQEIVELQQKIEAKDKAIQDFREKEVKTKGKEYEKWVKEKLQAKKAYDEALAKCKEQYKTLEAFEEALKHNQTEKSIADYMNAKKYYDYYADNLKLAGEAYKNVNNQLIASMKELEAAKNQLAEMVEDKAALTEEVSKIQDQIKIREGINEKIDKKLGEKAPEYKDAFKDAIKDAEKKKEKFGKNGMKKGWKIALWTAVGLAAAGLIEWGITELCNRKNHEAPAA